MQFKFNTEYQVTRDTNSFDKDDVVKVTYFDQFEDKNLVCLESVNTGTKGEYYLPSVPKGLFVEIHEPVKQLDSVWDTQTGGSHYSCMKLQPSQFCRMNNIPFHEGCVIKRMCRHKAKAGAEDCKKAIDEIRAILEEDYGVRSKLEVDQEAYNRSLTTWKKDK